jgi:hypothetical protein
VQCNCFVAGALYALERSRRPDRLFEMNSFGYVLRVQLNDTRAGV